MGRERTSGSGLETELAKHRGIEIHGGNLRVVFMWRRIRCREPLGLPITKANIKHAALLRAAILHEIKTGHFEYGRHFPNSKHATNYSSAKDERLGALLERYKPLKAVDITPMTEEKYGYALDICTALVGIDRLAGVLLPEDIQLLRTLLIADRAPSITTWRRSPVSWAGARPMDTAARDYQKRAIGSQCKAKSRIRLLVTNSSCWLIKDAFTPRTLRRLLWPCIPGFDQVRYVRWLLRTSTWTQDRSTSPAP